MRDIAVLLASELVANAVVHAAGPVTLTVQDTVDRVRVEVADNDPRPARPPTSEPSATGESGRGLQACSPSHPWGSDPRPGAAGKTTWFELQDHDNPPT